MKWIKKGRIFDPSASGVDWIKSYAALPVADLIDSNTLRIYFSTRDDKGRSLITYLETDPRTPENVKYVHDGPILSLGDRGTFDDNGMMPSWILNKDGKKYLYYIGWNPQQTVSYRLSIGLAISEDGGKSFQKFSKGPLLDRDMHEPFFNTAPCVLEVNGEYWLWYVSCTKWEMIKGWPEPFYDIKCAKSTDGIHWERQGVTCIGYDDFTQAIGKPCVFVENGVFKMMYSYRNATDYRTDPSKSYRLGYAESSDGKDWVRKDNEVGIVFSEAGWDSIMNEYCTTYQFEGKRYMIYNGNGFGESGFGYAIREEA